MTEAREVVLLAEGVVGVTTDAAPWPIYGPPIRGRACGSCHFCCTFVPVDEPLNKPAGVRCEHLCVKGCRIYAARPKPCECWNCAWLYQPDTAAMHRPDRAGYAIDPMLQTVLVDRRPMQVIQVWVDPARPDAHRDPALRDYLALMAERHLVAALVRWGDGNSQADSDALFLAAPAFTNGDGWIEQRQPMVSHAAFDALLKAAT